jgi:tetratricopeptide (TPR) repeat protein
VLGLALGGLGRHDESVAHLKRAHELIPNSDTYRLAYEAATTVEASDLVQPVSAEVVGAGTPGTNSAASGVVSALAALEAGQTDHALQSLQNAATRFPRDAATVRTLGFAYYRTGDYLNAHQSLRLAIDLDKSNALSYFLLGATLRKLGRTAEADAAMAEACARDSKYAAWRDRAE